MKLKTIAKVASVILSVCMLVTMFTCLTALPASASASDTQMLNAVASAAGLKFGWRSDSSSPLSAGGKYRLSLDWENVSNAPLDSSMLGIYCYSEGWKNIFNNDSYVSEWNVSSYALEHGNHYNIDFTMQSSLAECREFVVYFGDITNSISSYEFNTANWILYTRDDSENLTDTGKTFTFPVTFRGASDGAMDKYVSSYTGTDKGQLWANNTSSSYARSFVDIPEDYFKRLDACTHEHTHVVEATDSTCTTPGHDEYTICEDCGAVVDGDDTPFELDPDVHEDEKAIAMVPSTCKTHGHTAYVVCSGCGAIIDGENEELPLDPNNHDGEGTEQRNVIKATEETYGYTGDTYCLGCGAMLHTGEATPMIDAKMIHFAAGEDGWQVMGYKIGGNFAAGIYRFTVDELAVTGVKSHMQLYVNGSAYTTAVGVLSDVLDTENNKRTVEFQLWGAKADGAFIMIGNYGKGSNMETYYRNPALYLLDGEGGNPTGDNLIETFTADNVVLKTGTSRASCGVGKWTSLNWTSTRIMLEDIDYDLFGDQPIDDPDCPHANLKVVPAVASTCTTPGHGEYKICKKCLNVVEGSAEALPLDPDNHEATETRNFVKVTQTVDGYTGDIYCTGCDELLVRGEIVPAGSWLTKMFVWSGETKGYSRLIFRPDTGAFVAGEKYTFSMDMDLQNTEDESNFWGIYYRYGSSVDEFNRIAFADLQIVKTALPNGYHYEVTFTVPDDCYASDNILFRFGDINMNGYPPQLKLGNIDLWKLDGEGNKTEQIELNFPGSRDEVIPTADWPEKLYGASGVWYTVMNYDDGLTFEEQFGYFSDCAHANTEVRGATEANCLNPAYTGDTYCLDCGAKIALGEYVGEVDPSNHISMTEVRDAVEATCTTAGYTGDTYCLGCGEKIADGEEIAATGHTVGEWLSDETDHWHVCDTCQEQVDKAAHTASDWIVDVEATAEAAGHRYKECTVCGKVLEEEDIPALAPSHVPGDINGDSELNNKDLTRLFQYLSDWDVQVNEAALDVNGDGTVNNKDLTRLFQYLSDWDVEIF
ncbi:MAG: dockerin type I repeat-containing protein [Clostridia bacterium]|nr:dockerin type I repeat-containing protein [Clostridia bacterium]